MPAGQGLSRWVPEQNVQVMSLQVRSTSQSLTDHRVVVIQGLGQKFIGHRRVSSSQGSNLWVFIMKSVAQVERLYALVLEGQASFETVIMVQKGHQMVLLDFVSSVFSIRWLIT